MIEGAPKRPPGPRSETLTTRRLPLARAIQASSPDPFWPTARLGRNATLSVATVRGAPRDGPSGVPNATASRRCVADSVVSSSAAIERLAYGITCVVALGSARSGPKAGAPGPSDAPLTPFVAVLPTPSWNPQFRTTEPLPVAPACSGEMKVCGAEIVTGAVHVAALAGAAAIRAAAAPASAARAESGR